MNARTCHCSHVLPVMRIPIHYFTMDVFIVAYYDIPAMYRLR